MARNPVKVGKPVKEKPAATSSSKVGRSCRSTGADPLVRTELTHEQIASRARALWQAKGCPSGQDELNWREAEAQLKTELGIR